MSTDVTLSYAKSIKNTRTFLHITVILTVEIPMQCVYNVYIMRVERYS